MAIDPWIARGSPGLDVSNTLARIGALKQRDQALAQDAQQNAFMQQRFAGQQAQAEEDDAEWDAAYANRDWGTLMRLDPQAAKAIYEFEQSQQPQAPPAPIEEQTLPSGRVLAVQGGKPVGSPWARPQAAAGGSIAAPKPAKAPEGYRWSTEGESLEPIPGGPKDVSATQTLSPKDTNTARTKLTQVKVARQQLATAKKRYEALRGTFSAGIGGKLMYTPAGKAYDAAIDTMRSSITALTKVPGLGSMSDYETRLDQAKFPDRGKYEEAAVQQLDALEQLLDTVEGGYSEMLGQKKAETSPESVDPLAQYEGKTIKQGDKRFTVIKGKNGKFMAVEVK